MFTFSMSVQEVLPTATDVKLPEKSNAGLAAPKALLDAELRKTLNIVAEQLALGLLIHLFSE